MRSEKCVNDHLL